MDDLNKSNVNPWLVDSVQSFTFLCCPECTYRSKESETFEVHALQNHPMSLSLFRKDHEQVKDEPIEETEHDEQDTSDVKEALGDVHEEFKEEFNETSDDDTYVPQKQTPKKNKNGKTKSSKPAKEFECNQCSFKTKLQKYLQVHQKTSHPEVKESYNCDQCSYTTHASRYLTKHSEVHHGNKSDLKFNCDHCDFKTHSKVILWNHKYKHTGRPKSSNSSSKIKSEINTVYENDQVYTCPKCNEEYRGKYFVIHYRRAHGEFPPGLEDRKKYICDQCSAEFLEQHSLKRHMAVHQEGSDSAKDSYPCHVCPQKFNKLRYLIIHCRATHNTIPAECQDRPQFICDKCPDIFFSDETLKKHMLTHDGIKHPSKKRKKEFSKQCPQCEKTFRGYGNFYEHFRVVHQKLNLFDCQSCTRKFGSQTKLTEHIKNVHTRVNCDVCLQEVCNDFMLTRHKAKAHGIVPENVFQCSHCPIFFKSNKRLTYHLETKHDN